MRFTTFVLGSLVWGSQVVGAAEKSTEPATVFHFSQIRVQGSPLFGTLYRTEEIQAKPSSNQDISSLLEDNPVVRFGEQAGSSLNRGSLAVEEISIHGASPFQNVFSIDGVGATNNVDPAEKNGNLKPSTIPSHSQAYFIDTTLLESVAVYDRNIPIEYGGFTGGVVDARLKRAGDTNRFSASYRWNQSSLTQQKIATGNERNWNLGKPGFAPEWHKGFYRLAGEWRVNDQLGMTVSASKRKSLISRYQVVEQEGVNQQNQARFADEVDNVLTKWSYGYAPNAFVDLTLKYSDRKERVVSDVLRDTAWTNQHKAYGVALALEHRFDGGDKVKLQASWDAMGSSQHSSAHSLITHMKPGLANYTSGGYGKNEKAKQVALFGARYDVAPWAWGQSAHAGYVGLEVNHTDFRFERHQDSYSMIRRYDAQGNIKESNKVLNKQGKVSQQYNTFALYAGSRSQWRNWTLSAGVRLDRDDLFKNTNFSPRANVEWDAFGDGASMFSVGRSRYYGSDILNIALREKIETLRVGILDSKGRPIMSTSSLAVDYAGLQSPYDDEWALGWQQELGPMQAELSYVRRYGRRQVTRQTEGSQEYYENQGKSKNDSVALSLRQTEPWRWGASYWTTALQFGWQRTRRNSDYDIGYNSDALSENQDVLYNGSRIRYSDLPVSAFYLPRQLSLNINSYMPSQGWRWSNTWRWRSKRNSIVYVGRQAGLDSYESVRLGSYWLWDTKMSWAPQWMKGAELSVEVLNVLNSMPPIVAGNPNVNQNGTVYRSGREIWFQVGYNY